MGRITSTTRFTCDGFRKLRRRIGKQSQPAKHRKALDGSCYGTKSITKHQPAWAIKLSCAHGSVKRPGLPLNGSPKCSGAATGSCYQRLGRSGVRSMRKPAGRSACLLKSASNSRFKCIERNIGRDVVREQRLFGVPALAGPQLWVTICRRKPPEGGTPNQRRRFQVADESRGAVQNIFGTALQVRFAQHEIAVNVLVIVFVFESHRDQERERSGS